MKATHVPSHPHKHLKLLSIVCCYNELLKFLSDFELVEYIICNLVALKKIVIDPRWKARKVGATLMELAKNKEIVRHLESLTSRGVELVIL